MLARRRPHASGDKVAKAADNSRPLRCNLEGGGEAAGLGEGGVTRSNAQSWPSFWGGDDHGQGLFPHRVLAIMILTACVMLVLLVVASSKGQSRVPRWERSKFAPKDTTLLFTAAGPPKDAERGSNHAHPPTGRSSAEVRTQRCSGRPKEPFLQASKEAQATRCQGDTQGSQYRGAGGSRLEAAPEVLSDHDKDLMSQGSTSCSNGADSSSSSVEEEVKKEYGGPIFFALDAGSDTEEHAAGLGVHDGDAWY